MAHNLATINGRVSFAYQNSTPWHGLGERVASLTSVDAAITAGNLDWTVGLSPMFLADGRQVPDRRAVIRDTDAAILGTVGSRYTPIQNREGFGVLDEACRRHGVTIETVGALGQGERVFMLAKLPTDITVGDGDDVRGYFLLSMAHDGTGSFYGRPTPIRVVCQNTLNAAVRANVPDVIRLRHTKSAPQQIKQAETLVTTMIAALEQTGETFATLAAKRLSAREVQQYIARVFPLPAGETQPSGVLRNKRDAVAELVRVGVGADLAGARGDGSTTVWGAYNAVTEYFDHVRPASTSNVTAANTSALFGSGYDAKVQALEFARELVLA